MSKLSLNGKTVIGAFAPACGLCYDECEYCYYAENCKGFDNPAIAEVKVTPEVIEASANPENKITLVFEGGEC